MWKQPCCFWTFVSPRKFKAIPGRSVSSSFGVGFKSKRDHHLYLFLEWRRKKESSMGGELENDWAAQWRVQTRETRLLHGTWWVWCALCNLCFLSSVSYKMLSALNMFFTLPWRPMKNSGRQDLAIKPWRTIVWIVKVMWLVWRIRYDTVTFSPSSAHRKDKKVLPFPLGDYKVTLGLPFLFRE
jgi:hypothetical protein